MSTVPLQTTSASKDPHADAPTSGNQESSNKRHRDRDLEEDKESTSKRRKAEVGEVEVFGISSDGDDEDTNEEVDMEQGPQTGETAEEEADSTCRMSTCLECFIEEPCCGRCLLKEAIILDKKLHRSLDSQRGTEACPQYLLHCNSCEIITIHDIETALDDADRDEEEGEVKSSKASADEEACNWCSLDAELIAPKKGPKHSFLALASTCLHCGGVHEKWRGSSFMEDAVFIDEADRKNLPHLPQYKLFCGECDAQQDQIVSWLDRDESESESESESETSSSDEEGSEAFFAVPPQTEAKPTPTVISRFFLGMLPSAIKSNLFGKS